MQNLHISQCRIERKAESGGKSGTINKIVLKDVLRTLKRNPILAISHCAKKAQEVYTQNGINIVLKTANPPKCPELQTIERYWAHMKSKLKIQNARLQEQRSSAVCGENL
ncbi:PREDICTED: uncharacterized protein LOC108369567 [Rhagoletis zephyria]|uniref:uncharacterized protein LOC108369567 n=1 Tax=Rhagoletis zephyria TaxID=28612 RepID=UPI00081152F0|nr:PREDICTED: uncharacterized protein LOC108369567 [Rhagoletis zephyria]